MLPGEGRAIYYNAPEIREAVQKEEEDKRRAEAERMKRKHENLFLNSNPPVWDLFR